MLVWTGHLHLSEGNANFENYTLPYRTFANIIAFA